MPVLLSPADNATITDNTPDYQWEETGGATWYRLKVDEQGGSNVIYTWYQVGNGVTCTGGSCTLNPNTVLPNVTYDWTVQPWTNSAGAWYSAFSFTVNASASGFNSQFNGSTAGWGAHSGTWWNASSQWYTTDGVDDLWATASYAANFGNFDYSAKLWRNGCDNCSNTIIVRGTPDPLGPFNRWSTNYFFNYTRGGWYSVWRSNADGTETALQGWTESAAIVQDGAWNTLRVVANGSNLYFYINGTLVWSGSDGTYSSGRVGLGMYSNGNSGDQLWVDWATLTTSEALTITDTVSAEQQALNNAVNQREGDSSEAYREDETSLTPTPTVASQPLSTPTPTATSTPTPGEEPALTSTPTPTSTSIEEFDSQFNDSATGWKGHSSNWWVADDAWYTSQDDKDWTSTSYEEDYADFDYQVKLRREGCDHCANVLLIRGAPDPLSTDNNWHSAYLFEYTRKGDYSVWVNDGNSGSEWTSLQSWTETDAIDPYDNWNTLRVVANGTDLYFYINDTLVWSGTDSSLSSGRVGVAMYSDGTSGDQLWVDWAALTTSEDALTITDEVSDEQQALNEAANQREGDTPEAYQEDEIHLTSTPTATLQPSSTPTATQPVSTDTPEPTSTSTSTEEPEEPTSTPTPTSTATQPESTDTPEPTSTSTATEEPEPTETPQPTHTPTPTPQ